MGTENEEELYKRQQMDERLRVQEQTRQQQEALAKFRQEEEARKAAEANKGKMVADPESPVANWPDDGFQAAAPGRLDGVKAALAIGAPGDAALAAKLLNTGHAPAGSAAPAASADGAKEQTGSASPVRAAGAALGY
jgi:hypothetical protein